MVTKKICSSFLVTILLTLPISSFALDTRINNSTNSSNSEDNNEVVDENNQLVPQCDRGCLTNKVLLHMQQDFTKLMTQFKNPTGCPNLHIDLTCIGMSPKDWAKSFTVGHVANIESAELAREYNLPYRIGESAALGFHSTRTPDFLQALNLKILRAAVVGTPAQLLSVLSRQAWDFVGSGLPIFTPSQSLKSLKIIKQFTSEEDNFREQSPDSAHQAMFGGVTPSLFAGLKKVVSKLSSNSTSASFSTSALQTGGSTTSSAPPPGGEALAGKGRFQFFNVHCDLPPTIWSTSWVPNYFINEIPFLTMFFGDDEKKKTLVRMFKPTVCSRVDPNLQLSPLMLIPQIKAKIDSWGSPCAPFEQGSIFPYTRETEARSDAEAAGVFFNRWMTEQQGFRKLISWNTYKWKQGKDKFQYFYGDSLSNNKCVDSPVQSKEFYGDMTLDEIRNKVIAGAVWTQTKGVKEGLIPLPPLVLLASPVNWFNIPAAIVKILLDTLKVLKHMETQFPLHAIPDGHGFCTDLNRGITVNDFLNSRKPSGLLLAKPLNPKMEFVTYPLYCPGSLIPGNEEANSSEIAMPPQIDFDFNSILQSTQSLESLSEVPFVGE